LGKLVVSSITKVELGESGTTTLPVIDKRDGASGQARAGASGVFTSSSLKVEDVKTLRAPTPYASDWLSMRLTVAESDRLGGSVERDVSLQEASKSRGQSRPHVEFPLKYNRPLGITTR
jgi:hypothetical protein